MAFTVDTQFSLLGCLSAQKNEVGAQALGCSPDRALGHGLPKPSAQGSEALHPCPAS